METIERPSQFDEKFDQFKALAFIKNHISRNLRLLTFPDVFRFSKKPCPEAEFDNDLLDLWIDRWAEKSEIELLNQLPF